MKFSANLGFLWQELPLAEAIYAAKAAGFDAVECPKHNGRFDVRTGKALAAPVYEHLKTYPVQVRDGRVFVTLEN